MIKHSGTPTVGKDEAMKPPDEAPECAAVGQGDPENIDNA
jgi:hypothetical protein